MVIMVMIMLLAMMATKTIDAAVYKPARIIERKLTHPLGQSLETGGAGGTHKGNAGFSASVWSLPVDSVRILPKGRVLSCVSLQVVVFF